jgi:hypothetical protein
MKEVVGMKTRNRNKMSLAGERIGEALFESKLLGVIKGSLGKSRGRVETGLSADSTVANAEAFQVRAEFAKAQAELRLVQTSL